MSRSLIISIHDVAPPFGVEIEAILKRLSRLGVSNCSLLVVPDYHGTGRIDANPDWIATLRRWRNAGLEIVLHGYRHLAGETRAGAGFQAEFFRSHYTAGECEFLDLDPAEAEKRLRLGIEVLEKAGLAARGFVAPAWLMGPSVCGILKALGFEYTNTLKKIIDLRGAEVSNCWSQVYSTRALWRRWTSMAWNEALFQANRANPCLRISIHPPDIRYPVLWKHLESLIRRAVRTRKSMTYIDFVDRMRPAGV